MSFRVYTGCRRRCLNQHLSPSGMSHQHPTSMEFRIGPCPAGAQLKIPSPLFVAPPPPQEVSWLRATSPGGCVRLLTFSLALCFSQNICFPCPKTYVEILMCNTTVLGGEAFGTHLGPESSTLMNGISTLVKGTLQGVPW